MEVDVVVVGSGCAGLTAALTAKASGLKTIIIEKTAVFGGTTALSGGGAWIPNAPALRREVAGDDAAEALAYLVRIVGDEVPVSRLERFVDAAPRMMDFLEKLSPHLATGFFWGKGFPDYKLALGGSPLGRGIWPTPIDRRALGEDEKFIRGSWPRSRSLPRGMWLTFVDLREIIAIRWKSAGLKPYIALIRLLWRTAKSRITGERFVASGDALIARLHLAARDAQIPLLLNTPMRDLVTNSQGRICGVEVERAGKKQVIRARRGVILATGGFEHDGDMRREHQPFIGTGWSIASADNTGDGHRAALTAGARLELMDEAWWYPVIKLPDGYAGIGVEHKSAGQFIVNGAGMRFANEASDYNTLGKILIENHATGVSHIPAWMIIDERAWRHNIVCGHFPIGTMPANWLESGLVRKAATIEELARKIDVPAGALKATADRFNDFARAGKDLDFGRGESAYDNYYADPARKNPNLAEVKDPPFYAFEIYPGDIGTKGGVLTNQDGRALRKDGTPIPGLYAAGNVSASVMGRGYAGAGSTIGPAMTFAWVAARHIAVEAQISQDIPQKFQTSSAAQATTNS